MESSLKKKSNWLNVFVIITFVILYALTSSISMIHIVDFFELSNSRTMSWVLSIGFEVGAAASLAALTILDKLKKEIVIGIFILLTALQAMGNVYYSFTNLELAAIKDWVDLFGLGLMDSIQQKRIVAIVSGLPLPIIALGFIKSLVDYLKPTGRHTVFDEEETEGDLSTAEQEVRDAIDEYQANAPARKEKRDKEFKKVLEEYEKSNVDYSDIRDDGEDESLPPDDEDEDWPEPNEKLKEAAAEYKLTVDEENQRRFEKAEGKTHTELINELDKEEEFDKDEMLTADMKPEVPENSELISDESDSPINEVEIEQKEEDAPSYELDDEFYSELDKNDKEELTKRTVSLKQVRDQQDKEFEEEKKKRGFTDEEISKMKEKEEKKKRGGGQTPRVHT